VRRIGLAFLVLLVASAASADDPVAPTLTDATFESLRDAILPCEEECGFEAVGWRASFGAAVDEAAREGKPVLLWAMNGHPLGCT
jgi:hypothetical protein